MTDRHSQLVIREWLQPEKKWSLHGWEPKEGKVFAVHPGGSQQVLTLIRPLGAKQGFSDALPVEIVEVRLMPPPCRTDSAEAEALLTNTYPKSFPALHGLPTILGISGQPWPVPARSEWERIRLEYDKEILVPAPEDEPKLEEQLALFKSEREKEFAARSKELNNLLLGIRTIFTSSYYPHLNALQPNQALEHVAKQERMRLDMKFKEGCLRWTLHEARRSPAVRNIVLRSKWAKTVGLDLGEQAQARSQLFSPDSWLTPLTASNRENNPWLSGLKPDPSLPWNGYETPQDFGVKTDDDLTFCAQIRFQAKFENGDKAWLTNFTSRSAHNAGERHQFGSMEKAVTHIEAATAQTSRDVSELLGNSSDRTPAREEWSNNPMASREAMAEFILAITAVGVAQGVVFALMSYAYGSTARECAKGANISERTFKRHLALTKTTPYKKLFAGSAQARRRALRELAHPDTKFAWFRELAEKDPEQLRNLTEKTIERIHTKSDQ